MSPLIQGKSETTPVMSGNAFSTNQGTNEDDSQSDPHPEAGVFRNQTMRNSGQKDRRNNSQLVNQLNQNFCKLQRGKNPKVNFSFSYIKTFGQNSAERSLSCWRILKHFFRNYPLYIYAFRSYPLLMPIYVNDSSAFSFCFFMLTPRWKIFIHKKGAFWITIMRNVISVSVIVAAFMCLEYYKAVANTPSNKTLENREKLMTCHKFEKKILQKKGKNSARKEQQEALPKPLHLTETLLHVRWKLGRPAGVNWKYDEKNKKKLHLELLQNNFGAS